MKNNDASSDLKKQIYDVFDELATALQKEDAFTDKELEELFRYLWKRDPHILSIIISFLSFGGIFLLLNSTPKKDPDP